MSDKSDKIFNGEEEGKLFAPKPTRDASQRLSPPSNYTLRFTNSRSVSPCNMDNNNNTPSIDGELHRSDNEFYPDTEDEDNLHNVTQSSYTPPRLSQASEFQNDLITATAQNPTIVLELDMDCNVKFISKRWEGIVGTKISKIMRKPINDIIVGGEEDRKIFNKAVSIMMVDDDSYRVKFVVQTNLQNLDREHRVSSSSTTSADNRNRHSSVATAMITSPNDEYHDHNDTHNISELSLNSGLPSSDIEDDEDAGEEVTSVHSSASTLSTDGGLIEMEAQGILIHDKNTRQAVHSMWIVKPAIAPKELTLELPDALVLNLGFGINLFESYLIYLTELGVTDEDNLPKPPQELCRICEQHVPNWWLEKHSELCLLEHRIEDIVELDQDALTEHRKVILNLLEALARRPSISSLPSNPSSSSLISSSSSSSSSLSSSSSSSIIEYKGYPLPINSPIDSPIGRRKNSAPSIMAAKRFPIKNLDILLQYCDEALKVNPGEIKSDNEYMISYSPKSEKAMHNLSLIKIPESSDPTIKLITDDTGALVMAKMDAIARYAHTLQYCDKITKETDAMVLNMVKETIRKINEQMILISDIEDEDTSSFAIHSPKPYKTTDNNSSLIFDQAYIETNQPASLSREHLLLHNYKTESLSPRSLTPRSTGRSTPILHVSHHDLSDTEKSTKTSSTRSTAVSTPKRPLSPNFAVPMSSIQKNTKSSSNKLNSNISSSSTPISSPLLLSTDNNNNSNLLSISNIDKNQLSPLLVASTCKPSLPSLKDYEVIKPISKGAFGSVYLTRRNLTGEYFAMKILKKSDMIAKNQITNVKAERAIMMAQSNSPYVVQLFATFQSTNYLYLVMEYLNGGDCATLIKNMGSLPDVWAKRYIAEIVVGVEDLHSRGIVHRDLKPDNLLIDHNGHLKLTDFGLSRMGLVRRQKIISTSSPMIQSSKTNDGNYDTKRVTGSYSATLENTDDPFTASSSSTKSSGSTMNASATTNNNNNNYNAMSTPPAQILTSSHHRRLLSITPFSLTPASPLVTPVSSNLHTNFAFDDLDSPLHSESPQYQQHLSNLIQPPQFSDKTIRSLSNASNSLPNSPLLRPILQRNSSQSSFVFHEDSPGEITNYALFDPTLDEEEKEQQQQQLRRFVGTPDYLAPETVAGVSQDEVSDWWSIGCMLFEFLFGYTPFGGDSPEQIFDNILNGEIQWPPLSEDEMKSFCSDTAKDLIDKLLIKDPTIRLGVGGSDEIKRHPYFNGINWDTLFEEEASFVPNVENPESTDYFDSRGAEMNAFPIEDMMTSTDRSRRYTNDDNAILDDDEGDDEDDGTENNDSDLRIGMQQRNHPHHHHHHQQLHQHHNIPQPSTPTMFIRSDSSSSSGSTGNNRLGSGSGSGSSTPNIGKRERRASKLAIESSSSEFGSFNFRNLAALDKQNKDTINRLKNEHLEHRNSMSSSVSSTSDYFMINNSHSTGGSMNPQFVITPGSGISMNSMSGASTSGSSNNNNSNASNTPLNTSTRSRALSIGANKPLSQVVSSMAGTLGSSMSSNKNSSSGSNLSGRFANLSIDPAVVNLSSSGGGNSDCEVDASSQNTVLSPGLQMQRGGSGTGTASRSGSGSGSGSGSNHTTRSRSDSGSPVLSKSTLSKITSPIGYTNTTELGSPVIKFFNKQVMGMNNDFSPSSSSDTEDVVVGGGSGGNNSKVSTPGDKNSALFRISQRRSSRKTIHRSSTSSSKSISEHMNPTSNKRHSSSLRFTNDQFKDDEDRKDKVRGEEQDKGKFNYFDILLCEPIPIIRYSISKDLEGLGCDVLSVSNGSELIKRCTGEVKFDLIFTSLELNKLDSFDIIKLIRNTNEINSNTFIIGLTSFYSESRNLNLKNGELIDYILEYPINSEKLTMGLNKFKEFQLGTEEAIISDNE